MKKIVLIALLFLVNIAGVSAQDLAPVAVNGLSAAQQYTDAQVRAALGVPTRYRASTSENGETREYQYGPVGAYDLIRCSDAWGLETFELVTPRFSVFGGRLRVGDPLTKIYQLGFGRIESKGNGKYDCFVTQEDYPLEITAATNGIIVVIGYSRSL